MATYLKAHAALLLMLACPVHTPFVLLLICSSGIYGAPLLAGHFPGCTAARQTDPVLDPLWFWVHSKLSLT